MTVGEGLAVKGMTTLFEGVLDGVQLLSLLHERSASGEVLVGVVHHADEELLPSCETIGVDVLDA